MSYLIFRFEQEILNLVLTRGTKTLLGYGNV